MVWVQTQFPLTPAQEVQRHENEKENLVFFHDIGYNLFEINKLTLGEMEYIISTYNSVNRKREMQERTRGKR